MFRSKAHKARDINTPSALTLKAHQTNLACFRALVAAVEDEWEAPDPAQYETAYQVYVDDLLEPLDELEQSINEKRTLMRTKIERMIEIAPDFFEKALERSGLQSDHLIARGKE